MADPNAERSPGGRRSTLVPVSRMADWPTSMVADDVLDDAPVSTNEATSTEWKPCPESGTSVAREVTPAVVEATVARS